MIVAMPTFVSKLFSKKTFSLDRNSVLALKRVLLGFV